MAEYKTCKDCYHYEACKTMLEGIGFVVDGDGEDAEKLCKEFAPAADVVEVCRCRDCKWTDNVLFKNKVIWCNHDEQWVEEDNFCKCGKKRC